MPDIGSAKCGSRGRAESGDAQSSPSADRTAAQTPRLVLAAVLRARLAMVLMPATEPAFCARVNVSAGSVNRCRLIAGFGGRVGVRGGCSDDVVRRQRRPIQLTVGGASRVRGDRRESRCAAHPATVAELSQNPIVLTQFRFCFERKQIPRTVGNVRKPLNAKEAREAVRIRPRQVRYQAALRPDSPRFYLVFSPSLTPPASAKDCPGPPGRCGPSENVTTANPVSSYL
jgi:hypothetical protein